MRNEDFSDAMDVIRQACASVNANLDTHQKIQASIMAVEDYVRDLQANQRKVKEPVKDELPNASQRP